MDTKRASGTAGRKKENFWQNMFKHKGLYLMAFPGIIWFVLFQYVTLAGSVIAFMDYDIYKGIYISTKEYMEELDRITKDEKEENL